ncbi:restriction endonuclease subunit S [Aliarcobacter butzleri]|uniref:restriction endonuclease subunit S n=1 Tax=Aliarcobacter butzleri TaxID=28197 RepID=UPI00191B37B5|nr:restriction endonuclease subunit S [Aliarcobacter butzleri]MDN5099083.1 restriction endonuclease subunit S [Aliarcobacter butzleri]MDN5128374.1 restriction endonuclease subunit S [Aliarcobacter butzleri]
MSSWRECKLWDVAEVKGGKRLPKGELLTTEKTPHPYIRITDFDGHKINLSAIQYVTEEVQKSISRYIVNKQDIIISNVGTIGLCAKIPDELDNANLTENCVKLVFDKNKIDTNFLYYHLISPDTQELINSLDVGSTQPKLPIYNIQKIDISLPPLEEQKAIAEVLCSFDDKIDLLHRQNQTLESLAQTLFRQWFIEEAKEEWEEKTLSYFGDIICGKTPSKSNSQYFDGNVPFIKIPDMHGNTFIFKTTDTLSEIGKESQKNKTLPPKSICVSCIATVGLVSMNIIESQTNQQINSIIPNKDIYRYFIYLFMQSSYDLLHAMASGGTATLNLNTGDFSKMEILKPDDETLKIFHQVIEPTFDKIFINSKQIQTLENLRDTLLPKLLSGEVRVKI